MIKLKLTIFLCLLFSSCEGQVNDREVQDDSRGGIDEKCVLIANRLNAFYSNNSFPSKAVYQNSFPFKTDKSRQYQQKIFVVGSGRTESRFRLLKDSLKLISFMNGEASDYAYGSKATLHDEASTPTWDTQKSVNLAREFAQAALGVFPKNVKQHAAEFNHPFRERDKFYDGIWFVTFRRINQDGHFFMNDAITVQINEKFGPVSLGIVLPSRYEEAEFDPIPQQKAAQKAIAGARQILNWQPAKMGGWFESHQLNEKAISSELWVVNPNYLTQRNSITEVTKQTTLEARLAWVVKFKASSEQPEAGDHEINVWIDAENGKILGGDFK